MNAPYALVIFDCDGVLVDSELLACEVLAAALTKHGIPFTAAAVLDRFLGRSLASVRRYADELRIALPTDFEAEIARRLLDRFEEELRPITGVADVIRHLGGRICVASSSQRWRVDRSLELAGLKVFFGPDVFTVDMVLEGKPAPDLFLHAASKMKMPVERCLVIEDSASGVQAARAAGMDVWGFTGGSHHADVDQSAESLRRAGAQRVFGDMSAFWPAPSSPCRAPQRAR